MMNKNITLKINANQKQEFLRQITTLNMSFNKFVAHINNISLGKNSNSTQLNIFFVN